MVVTKELQYLYSANEGKALLRLARSAIMDHLNVEDRSFNKEGMADKLRAPCFRYNLGNFVTLKLSDVLRGCIGSLQSSEPIVEGIKGNAINAAFHDLRFLPLNKKEFLEVTIDISILTPPTPLPYDGADNLLHTLHRGVDGVVLKKGAASATFLPQVWDQLPLAEDFLSQLCLKAGLLSDAWQTECLEILTYQVQHFSE